MLLKSIPPAVTPRAECMSFGSSRVPGLPMCFDSDSDVQSTSASIPEKVQMIIDSLKSSQSSQDVGNENKRPVPPKPGVWLKDRTEKQSQHSDSNDSLDREIEEAIKDYLKEKSHRKKMKCEPRPNSHADNKILKTTRGTNSCFVDNKCTGIKILSEDYLSCFKFKNSSINSTIHSHQEKYVAYSFRDGGIEEDTQRHQAQKNMKVKDPHTVFTSLCLKEESVSSSEDGTEEAIQRYQLEKQNEKVKGSQTLCKPLQLKEESDSSSDDGIEEAIQRYQLEKQYEKVKRSQTLCKPLQLKGESDSSSDDGIEEAIQRYQLEKQNEKVKRSQTLCKSLELKGESDSSSDDGIEEAIQRYQLEKQNEKVKRSQTLCKSLELKEESDSSSDDGIEEAIQRYQIEKQNEKVKGSQTLCKPLQLKEESDSSSDDGIEAAIQRYQLEKQNEEVKRSLTLCQPLFSKHSQFRENASFGSDGGMVKATYCNKTENQKMNMKKVKKCKLSKNKHRKENKEGNLAVSRKANQPTTSETQIVLKKKPSSKRKTENLTSLLSTPVPSCLSPSEPLSRYNINESIFLCINNPPLQSQIPSSINVNASPEIICTEAIINNSKAIIPTTVDHSVKLTTTSVHQMPSLNRDSVNGSDDNHGNSMDKVDKIAPQQEKNADHSQNKKMRLSLSRKRKLKGDFHEADRSQCKGLVFCNKSNISLNSTLNRSAEPCENLVLKQTANAEEPTNKNKKMLQIKEDVTKMSKSHRNCADLQQPKPGACSYIREQAGEQNEDRSRSLESDEEPETAFGNSLKSKKKIKRETTDPGLKVKKNVSFGGVQLCFLGAEISDKETLGESNMGYFKTAKSYISKNTKLAKSQSMISRKHLKQRLIKDTSERLTGELPAEAKVQTGATDTTKSNCGIQMEKDINSVDCDDSTEQMVIGFVSRKDKEMTKGQPTKMSITSIAHSVTAMELNLKSQQAESQASVEVPFRLNFESDQQGCVEGKVLHSAPIDVQGHSKFCTDERTSIKTEATNLTFKNDLLNEAVEIKQKCIVKRIQLVTSADMENSRSAKCIFSSNTSINAAVVNKLPQSVEKNIFHTHAFSSTKTEEIRLINASDCLAKFHEKDFNSSLCLDNSINPCNHCQDPPVDACSPLPALTRAVGLAVKCGDPERNVEEEEKIAGGESEYVDEADYESDERMDTANSFGEKLKSRLSLSTTIDPGLEFTPYIALNTPQRYQKSRTPVVTAVQQIIKMKLPADRVNLKPAEQHNHNLHLSINVKTFYASTTLQTHVPSKMNKGWTIKGIV